VGAVVWLSSFLVYPLSPASTRDYLSLDLNRQQALRCAVRDTQLTNLTY